MRSKIWSKKSQAFWKHLAKSSHQWLHFAFSPKFGAFLLQPNAHYAHLTINAMDIRTPGLSPLKKLFLPLFFVVCGLLYSSPTQATHLLGSEISWESLGNDSFKVTVSVYRDCNGVQLSNQPLTLSSNCGTMRVSTTMTGGYDATSNCKRSCTRCSSRGCGFAYGIQKWHLTGIVSLASWRKNGCCEVTISSGQCCRSRSITTGAASNNFYVQAQMNICDTSTVQWDNIPTHMVCLGKDVEMNQGSFTTSSPTDSVVYSWDEPLQNATSKTNWSSPYQYDKPLYFLGFPKTTLKLPRGLHLDAQTGKIAFRPMKTEFGVIKIKAEIFRNGKSIGYSVRDQTIIVTKCANTTSSPRISSYDCSGSRGHGGTIEFQACASENIDFNICTTDKDQDDSVSVTLNYNIPGARVSINNKGSNREGIRVQWQPDSTHIRSAPYVITIKANDNSCPISNITEVNLNIYVSKGKPISITKQDLSCGKKLFIAKGNDSLHRTTWRIHDEVNRHLQYQYPATDSVDSFAHAFKLPGRYFVSVKSANSKGCLAYGGDSTTVTNDFLHLLRPPALVRACLDDTVELEVKSKGSSALKEFVWWGIDTVSQTDSSHTIRIPATFRTVYYGVSDSVCQQSGATRIIPYEFKYTSLQGNQTVGCDGDTLQITAFNNPGYVLDEIVSFDWQYPKGRFVSKHSNLSTYETGYYYFHAKSKWGCEMMDSIKMLFKQPKFSLPPSDTVVCADEGAIFTAKSSQMGEYDWYVHSITHIDSFIDTPSIKVIPVVGRKPIVVRFRDTRYGVSCETLDTFTYGIKRTRPITIAHRDTVCQGDSMTVGTNLKQPEWWFQNQFQSTRKVFIDPALGAGYLALKFNGRDSTGCIRDSQSIVWVEKQPRVDFTMKDTIFRNRTLRLTSEYSDSTYSYFWQVRGANLRHTKRKFEFNIDSVGVFEVSLRIDNTLNGCTDSLMRQLVIRDKPTGIPLVDLASFHIYPNPANDILYIEPSKSVDYQVSIINVSGQQVLEQRQVNQTTSIDLSSLPNGIYLLKLENTNTVKTMLIEVIH